MKVGWKEKLVGVIVFSIMASPLIIPTILGAVLIWVCNPGPLLQRIGWTLLGGVAALVVAVGYLSN